MTAAPASCSAPSWSGPDRAEIAKRVDVFATATASGAAVADLADLDLSHTPPLGSPWDAVQVAAMTWQRTVAETAGAASRG